MWPLVLQSPDLRSCESVFSRPHLAGSFKLRTCRGSYIFWPTLIEMDDQRVLSSCEDVATVSTSLLLLCKYLERLTAVPLIRPLTALLKISSTTVQPKLLQCPNQPTVIGMPLGLGLPWYEALY